MKPTTPGVTLIDCDYLRPRFAGSYLVENEGKALFVDNNTAHSVPLLLAALARSGLKPEDVEFLVVTHIHLDHAGGTSELLRACPNATVLAHPRAAPHLVDPTKLVGSAKKVYGEAEFAKLYGVIHPIASERVRAVEDEECIPFGGSELRFLHTRGHANHHMCIRYESAIFTGDSFGLAYPDLQTHGLFIFPSTSPTDFNCEEAKNSIRKIVKSGASEALLTHFGSVTDLGKAKTQLMQSLDASESILQEAVSARLSGDTLEAFCKAEVHRQMHDRLVHAGIPMSDDVRDLLQLDLDLNAQGLAHVARKTLEKAEMAH